MKKSDLILQHFYEIKEKNPTAILLFRCGDFYETYEQDACLCSKLLGITLTKSIKGGNRIAGFPHHALDEYLPKLVRHCNQPESVMKRVAICDLPTNEFNNPKNQETMKLSINNQNQESVNVATMPAVNNQATAIAEPMGAGEYVEFEEVKTQSAQKTQSNQNARSNRSSQKKEAKSEAPSYSVVTYTTKKGGTAGYVMGFKTEQEVKALADNACKTVGATWRYNDKGEKVYGLSFGVRYMDVARMLCDALNKGDKAVVSKAIAQTHDIYAAAVEAGKAERERKQQERVAQKAKAEADELIKVKKANGLYSMTEIAEMMKRALAGEDVPELKAVKEMLAA